jgi:hypothetical protein
MFVAAVTGRTDPQEAQCFAARFFSLARLSRASFFSKSAFDTLRTMLSAWLSRSAGVSPGTFGATGNGFMRHHNTPETQVFCSPMVENGHSLLLRWNVQGCRLPLISQRFAQNMGNEHQINC